MRGNAAILVGVQHEKVGALPTIPRTHCHVRRGFVLPMVRLPEPASARHWVHPLELEGAAVLVLNTARFEQL